MVSNTVGGQMLCQTTIGAQRYSIPKPMPCDKLKLQLTGIAAEPVLMQLQLFKVNLIHYKSKGYVCRICRRTET